MRPVSTVLITALVMACTAVVGMTAQNPGGSPEPRNVVNPVKATPDSMAAGKSVFLQSCWFCGIFAVIREGGRLRSIGPRTKK